MVSFVVDDLGWDVVGLFVEIDGIAQYRLFNSTETKISYKTKRCSKLVHNAFLEYPSSGTLSQKIGWPHNFNNFGVNKTNGHKAG